MADSFGIPQLIDYLTQMGLRIANVDLDQEIIELAFHGDNGQWRLIINIQQSDEIRKLMLIVPHIGTVTTKKRLQCLEALLAVNYRIAMGNLALTWKMVRYVWRRLCHSQTQVSHRNSFSLSSVQ